MKKKAVFGTVVLVAGVSAGAWLGLGKGDSADLGFKLEAVSRGDIEAVVTASGTVKAITLVEVGSQVSGKIKRMAVDYNAQVKEGQILAEIDPQPSQAKVSQSNANYLSALAALEKAKITVANLKAKYERSVDLAANRLVSPEDLEAAEANYLSAKSSLEDAESGVDKSKSALESSRLDLGYCIIRSPIDGLVISRNMQAGQTVQANFQAVKMFEIASDLSRMKVECDVDEADVGKIAEGQTARFTVDAFPESNFAGQVQQVRYSPTMTSNVVTYTAIIDVDNRELQLRPGMTAAVTIVVGEAKAALLVPATALRFTPKLPAEEVARLAKEARDAGQAARKTPGARQVVLWHLDEKGELRAAAVGAGISNTAYVVILAGDLKEGGKVITGYETAEQAAARRQEGPPPGAMMMGAPPPPPPPPGGGGPPPPR
jgi:HlyD family secretion protein